MLSLQVAWGVICVLDTKILLHSLLSLCFCPDSMIQTLLCWVVWPSMSSILHPQWSKAGTALPHLAEPVLPGSVCSSRGLPCCWLYISLYPNPFHTSGKIPLRCLWTCWVGLQVPDPARAPRTGLPAPSPSLGLSCWCCVQPMFLGWEMGLLFGCCGQSHWAVFPDSQPASCSTFCFGSVPSLVEGALTQP